MTEFSQDRLRRKQFDERLKTSRKGLEFVSEPLGWVRMIRELLGMTTAQLARRTEINQPNVTQIEERELKGTVSLNTLRKMANALDCDLVYGLLPRKPLNQLVEDQLRKTAERLVAQTARTMSLEDQRTSKTRQEELVREVMEDLARKRPSRIWDEEQ